MQRRDRMLVTATLMVGVLNLIVLGSIAGPRAYAATSAWLDDLGPAAKLTLTTDDTSVDIVATEGRLAWGDDEANRVYSVGFVHVGRMLDAIMQSDSYADIRAEMEERFTEERDALISEIEDFQERVQGIDPDDPAFEGLAQEWEELNGRRRMVEEEASRTYSGLLTDQMTSAYRDIVNAVEVVSDRRDIDIVLRFIPTSNDFQGMSPDQIGQGILSRVALRYPDGLDITDDVIEEMALD
ncbi:MAG: OmpH family outer membrane protein [Planctomycetota bacterium]